MQNSDGEHQTTEIVRDRRAMLRKLGLPVDTTDREMAQLGVKDLRLASSGNPVVVREIEEFIETLGERIDNLVRAEIDPSYGGTVIRYDWRSFRNRNWGGKYSAQFLTRYGDDCHRVPGISLGLYPEILDVPVFVEYTHISHSPTIGVLKKLQYGEYLTCLCCHEIAHAVDKARSGHGGDWQKIYRILRIGTEMVAPWRDDTIVEPLWPIARRRPIKDPEGFQALAYDESAYRREQRQRQQSARRERKRRSI